MDLVGTLEKAVETDPDGAGFLMDLACYTMAVEAAKVVEPLVTAAVVKHGMTEVAKRKAELVRGYVAKASSGSYPEATYLTAATWLDGISRFLEVAKAENWEEWYQNNKRVRMQVSRDALGRFAPISGNRPVVGTPEANMRGGRLGPVEEQTDVGGAQKRVKLAPGVADTEKEALNRFQGAWEVTHQRGKMAWDMMNPEDRRKATVMLSTNDPNQQDFEVPLAWIANPSDGANLKNLGGEFKNLGQHITGMRVIFPEGMSYEQQQDVGARVNQLGTLGRLDRFSRALGGRKGQADQFLNAPDSKNNPRMTAAIHRVGMAGDVLGSVAPGSKSARIAQFVGMHGPEAMEALGPHVRRGAYRYRGVEKRPDKALSDQLHGQIGDTIDSLARAIDSGQTTAVQAARKVGPARDGQGRPTQFDEPALQSVRWRGQADPNSTGDSMRLGVRSDTVAAALLNTLPKNPLHAMISRDAGKGLPSHGVMIDKDGNAISQAVGYADDHYLPFNLANMAKLRGGQYARTRVQGGLTGEDVFATVFGGARSATVASSSGVYRLEMAPDFRGARAMNDKAAAMYDSYLNILQAVSTSDRYLDDSVDKEIKDQAHIKAKAKFPNAPITDPRFIEERTKLEAQYRAERSEVQPEERAGFQDEAKAAHPGDLGAQREYVKTKVAEAQKTKLNKVTLNAEGYKLALDTLAQQFPYYIRKVEHTPLTGEPSQDAGGTEWKRQGFIARMGLRPGIAQANAGDDQNIQLRGQEKWRTGYQRPGAAAPAAPAAQAAPPPPSPGAPSAPSGPAAAGGGGAPAAAPAATSSPAAMQAKAKAGINKTMRDKAMHDFIAPFSGVLATPDAIANDATLFAPDATLASLPNRAQQIEFLLRSESNKELNDRITAEPDLAFRALAATPEEWKEGLNKAFAEEGLKTVLAANPIFEQDTVDGLVKETRIRAKHALDAALMPESFAEATAESTRTEVARALDIPDITSAESAADLESKLADPANTAVLGLVAELGVDADGRATSMVDAGEKMKSVLDGLNEIDKRRDELKTGGGTFTVAQAISSLNLDPDFRALTELKDADLERMLDMGAGHRPDETTEIAERWQRARTILETGRAFDLVKAGGAFPKAWEATVPRLVKDKRQPGHPKVAKAWSRPGLHPQAEALAVVVSKRIAQGLPPVAPRRRRTLSG